MCILLNSLNTDVYMLDGKGICPAKDRTWTWVIPTLLPEEGLPFIWVSSGLTSVHPDMLDQSSHSQEDGPRELGRG